MLQITIPEREYFDHEKQEFIYLKKQELILEHSLISISKWESKWKKPFFDKKPKTTEESIDYIRCMTVNSVDPLVYKGINQTTLKWLGRETIDQINAYIEDNMTATWFNDKNSKVNSGQSITAELIYYWMVAFHIPFTPCEKWHVNKLLTLIKICELKSSPKKRMKRKDIYARNAALNEARKRSMGTTG